MKFELASSVCSPNIVWLGAEFILVSAGNYEVPVTETRKQKPNPAAHQ